MTGEEGMEKFSISYDLSAQRKFLEFLNEGKLERAVKTLEGMVRGINVGEEAQRIRVILEGYRIIFSRFGVSLGNSDDKDELDEYRKLGSLESLKEELEDYRGLDSTHVELDKALNLLKDYEGYMGDEYINKDFAEISSDLGELEIYRGIGTIEELEQLVNAQKVLDSI